MKVPFYWFRDESHDLIEFDQFYWEVSTQEVEKVRSMEIEEQETFESNQKNKILNLDG